MEQLKTIGRELAMGSQGGWGQSKEFLDLVKSIGEARSKVEEDRIILREIETLKRRIAEPDVTRRKMKEYIIRLVYVEMLGHDASFGYIHAVKMTHDDNVSHKRTGYLAVTLFLNEDHDLIILIVNTIQKDLRSDNYLVVCAALTAVCKLINEETIPAVLPQVVELLGHSKEAVRKKAIMALHRFYQRAPASVAHLLSHFRKIILTADEIALNAFKDCRFLLDGIQAIKFSALSYDKRLSDNDPGVMGAALCPLFDLITADVNSYKDLVISFVSILKQVAERRLPKAYDYHQTPAPFIQVKLLKILALLGSGDKQASGHMYTVLGEIIRKVEMSSNIGNAVLYECICCVSSIHPNTKLLDAAIETTSKFLKDPDDTLKRKTFELLYKMTKSTNVEVIVDRMIDYMISINDNHYKTEIASRCVELAEQFAPSNQWFIQTMNKVFEHAGDLVNVKVAHNLMRLIAEGFGEDDEGADSQLRSSAVSSYLGILGEPKLPSMFLQVICWVLGEYGTADGNYSASYIIGKLCDVVEAHPNDITVKAYAITGIMKIYAFEVAAGRKVEMLSECQSLIEELQASHSTDLQQRAYELKALLGLDSHAVQHVMPLDASCEDIEVDKNLSFLNKFVQQAIEKGSQPYIPESERSGFSEVGNFKTLNEHENAGHGLRFEAYELPKPVPPVNISPAPHAPQITHTIPVSEPSHPREINQNPNPSSSADTSSANSEIKLQLGGVPMKWGKPAYSSSSSSSSGTISNTANGVAHRDAAAITAASQTRDFTYNHRRQQVEVSAEKQRLAASLFGKSSKSEKKVPSTNKASKASFPNTEKLAAKPLPAAEAPKEKLSNSSPQPPPPPDLLDFSESSPSIPAPEDPFKQLEELVGPSAAVVPEAHDIMGLYGLNFSPVTPANRNSEEANIVVANKKGPNLRDALEKDSVARQVGVTPTGNNPNLFRDLLG
ncbi:AP-4 complex subunit epsilon [Dendrobium catenatum]|uniref:AP-4 complex subunit epsilon n=1 Tax=Dendrobium catenatum TaxID=906689 RepID=A0A2I0WPJ9_9ASPA|nr:AP-4 complex subunit epsilon [Dendrobium catenatum]